MTRIKGPVCKMQIEEAYWLMWMMILGTATVAILNSVLSWLNI